MNKFVIATAAVLLTAGVAFAQSDAPPAPGAGPAEAAPPAAAPFNGGEAAEPGTRPGRPDWKRDHHGKKMHPRGGPHGRGPHGGMMMHPSKGASFVFTAPGEGRIMIKCADEDSTQACADAVKPLLELMLNAGGGAAAAQ